MSAILAVGLLARRDPVSHPLKKDVTGRQQLGHPIR
jgi:hypothetical protein